jgi:hypothetical protein
MNIMGTMDTLANVRSSRHLSTHCPFTVLPLVVGIYMHALTSDSLWRAGTLV